MNAALFPDESAVGYPGELTTERSVGIHVVLTLSLGPTPTGIEPDAIETAASYPTNDQSAATFPLIIGETEDNAPGFDYSRYWGNLSPWYSVPSSTYGLPKASPKLPDQCSITQVT